MVVTEVMQIVGVRGEDAETGGDGGGGLAGVNPRKNWVKQKEEEDLLYDKINMVMSELF